MVLSVRQGLVYLLAGASCVSAAAIQRRDEIAHDSVVGFPETVPSDVGAVYQKFKPYLKVDSGCVPFPAVDASGNTNAGLNPTGEPNGGCSSSPGQVYVRGAQSGSSYAVMYSWYFPKDSPGSGLGHRHDWEGVVVWLSEASTSAEILGVAASGHGEYETNTSPSLSGTRPLIRYYNIFPVNHQMGFTSTQGGDQPLIAWESLPQAAQDALQNTDFGDANVPFKDGNFEDNLGKAAL
ncbi:hypothetical protein SLS57_008819 [Botryosphaeria dothidea]